MSAPQRSGLPAPVVPPTHTENNKVDLVQLSKKLSYHLRHDPTVTPDAQGWVSLNRIKDRRIHHHLDEIVESSDKKRFELDKENKKIRARQGHSIPTVKEEGLLTPVTADKDGKFNGYAYGVHSTFSKTIPLIKASGGISRRGRNHVHMMLANLDDIKNLNKDEVIPGMRKGATAFIAVNLREAEKEGCSFYLSGNGVFLCNGSKKYGCIPWKVCTVYQ